MFFDTLRLLTANPVNSVSGKFESQNLVGEIAIILQRCTPKCGHVMVDFNHYCLINKVLHYRGKGNDATSGEWLNQHTVT